MGDFHTQLLLAQLLIALSAMFSDKKKGKKLKIEDVAPQFNSPSRKAFNRKASNVLRVKSVASILDEALAKREVKSSGE